MIDGYAVVGRDIKEPFIFTARIRKLLAKWKQWRQEEESRGANTGDITICMDGLEELISPNERLEYTGDPLAPWV